MENCLFIIICKDIGKITIGEEIIKMYELMKNINKEDFRSNLEIWWKKYAHKNPQISDEIREILDEIYEK